MWTILTEAATNAPEPPQVPSELIGVVLTALITGATAVIVAIVQRKKSPVPQEATATGSRPFAVSESEWIAVRDRSVENSATHKSLCERFDGHVRISDEALSEIREDIARLKGQLGIQ